MRDKRAKAKERGRTRKNLTPGNVAGSRFGLMANESTSNLEGAGRQGAIAGAGAGDGRVWVWAKSGRGPEGGASAPLADTGRAC